MRTTLNKIRKHGPCTDGWEKLLRHLGKTMADDEPLSITTVLDSNGLDDALWCLRAVDGCERDLRLYAVWCARQVQYLMTDYRSIRALDVAERYSHGSATDAEMAAARAAAWAAADAARVAASDAGWAAARVAEDAARAAAWDAVDAARAVEDAARAAVWAAARAAEDAARAAVWAAARAVEDAASDAARAAAWAAADAASDAAWAAARAAQEAELRRLCAMTDRELLELAAKAAGVAGVVTNGRMVINEAGKVWNPLNSDGDALRLAVKLGLDVCIETLDLNEPHTHVVGFLSEHTTKPFSAIEYHHSDSYAATRRAIVRAAAEIGKGMN